MMVTVGNELQDRGHDIEFLVVDPTGPFRDLISSSVSVVEIGGNTMFSIFRNLRKQLRVGNTDVLLSTLEIPNIISALATRTPVSVPVVLRSASIYSERERSGKYRIIPLLKKFTYPLASRIIAISGSVANDLSNITCIPDDEIITVYNPAYDPSILTKATEPVQHTWFEDDNIQVVLGVGSLKPAKDFSMLIRAIHRLRDEDDIRLVILGDGSEKEELKQLVADLDMKDYVSFLGFVDNPHAYMSKANVFALSSAWEGFGNVIVEVMACGTPVVSTNCPGGPSEILNNGEYGPLVPVGDDEAMAKAINKVLADPLDSSVLQSRAEDFAIEPIVDQYEDVLLSVIE